MTIVSTLHDKDGLLTEYLFQALPTLKSIFKAAFISITPLTASNKEVVNKLKNEPFFILNFNNSTATRDHFISAFQNAVKYSKPKEILHICDLDRLLFALLSNYRNLFLKDITHINPSETPMLYSRSETAWQSHPQNYRAIEFMVASLAETLFGTKLDYLWPYGILTAKDLQALLPQLKAINIVYPHTEIAFLLRNKAKTKTVDWLSWEDPFIFKKDPNHLKKEKETDLKESEKRLSYGLPVIKYLLAKFQT